MPPARGFIVRMALRMDRIKDAKFRKKMVVNKDCPDGYDPVGITVKVRRVRPGYTEIQTQRALIEDNGAFWQVIDVDGTLPSKGFDRTGGHLIIDGYIWLIQSINPTAAEVVLECGCTLVPR